MRTGFLFAILLVLFNTASMRAQRGEPMMVYTEGGQAIRGVILAVDDSMLYVDCAGQKWDAVATPSVVHVSVLPLGSVEFLERKGRPWNAKGALMGMLVGTGFGALTGWISHEEPKPGSRAIDFGPAFSAVFGGLLWGGLGVIVGCIVDIAAIVPEKNIDLSTEDGYRELQEIAVYGNILPPALRAGLKPPITVSH